MQRAELKRNKSGVQDTASKRPNREFTLKVGHGVTRPQAWELMATPALAWVFFPTFFVLAVLFACAFVYYYFDRHEPERAIPFTIAVRFTWRSVCFCVCSVRDVALTALGPSATLIGSFCC